MKFLLLIHDGTGTVEAGPDEASPDAWVDEMDGRGVRLLGERLSPVEETVTVRVRGGRTAVTDGPFAETKEQIAGFDVLECADLDEAVEVASKHPMAGLGSVEVRACWPDS